MDQTAAAIADPVRRAILELVGQEPRTAGDIAGRFAISRPAISRHLRVLRDSGLVADTVRGRNRVYALTPEPLAAVAQWIGDLGSSDIWPARLAALDTEVHRTVRDRRRSLPTATSHQETG